MNAGKLFLVLLAGFTAILLSAGSSMACSCGPSPSVLEEYDAADVVVVTRAISIQKAEEGRGYKGVISTRMMVETVYKGNLKVGDVLTFAQGGGADCVWTFDERAVDQEYLFYLHSSEKNPTLWIPYGCGRSNTLRDATDDLLYLNKRSKVSGKTRVSGTIEFKDGAGNIVEGMKIRIIGANKAYDVKTDSHGVYEIYDLPAGQYLIEPNIPTGWKVDVFWLEYSSSFVGDRNTKMLKQIPIVLRDKKHANLDIHFEIDNAIRGKVFDPSGTPMRDVCVQAVNPEDGKRSGYFADCTNENGEFAITEIPQGSYALAVNNNGKISSSEPFTRFYYPTAADVTRAAVFTVGAGQFIDDIKIYVPKVEATIVVDGTVRYSDGKPVDDAYIKFKASVSNGKIDGNAHARTDANGHFSIRVLKGLKGELYGELSAYIGKFENCPKVDAMVRQSGLSLAPLKSSAVEIDNTDDLHDVKLTFSFPPCKKTRE